MSMSATALANSLIEDLDGGGVEEIQVHEFADQAAAEDDVAIKGLYAQFAADFDEIAAELDVQYGRPVDTGNTDHESIPLKGVFRYAVWEVEGKVLYLAAAHEATGAAIVLMLGTAAGG